MYWTHLQGNESVSLNLRHLKVMHAESIIYKCVFLLNYVMFMFCIFTCVHVTYIIMFIIIIAVIQFYICLQLLESQFDPEAKFRALIAAGSLVCHMTCIRDTHTCIIKYYEQTCKLEVSCARVIMGLGCICTRPNYNVCACTCSIWMIIKSRC